MASPSSVRIVTRSPAETIALGRRLARALVGGETIGLIGGLGSGKTTLVRGLLAAFGVRRAQSPTFVLVRHLTVRQRRVRRIAHADLYRLAPGSDLRELGLDELRGRRDAVTIIEWFDRLRARPADSLLIRCSVRGRSKRCVVLPSALARELTHSAARSVLARGRSSHRRGEPPRHRR